MAKKQDNRKGKVVKEAAELTGTENFLDKNKRLFLIVGGGVLLLLVGYIGYMKFIKEPKEVESQEVLADAFYEFEQDSIDKAINGSDNFLGMADIADDYKGTSGGDIANYSMGIMSMNNGEFDVALDYLQDCDFEDIIVGSLCLGLQGDCYVEMGEYEKAAKHFEKAANRELNEFTTPMFLKKAAQVREELGDKKTAHKHYSRIKADYSKTEFATDIDKFVARTKS